jgi:hypothetical protein
MSMARRLNLSSLPWNSCWPTPNFPSAPARLRLAVVNNAAAYLLRRNAATGDPADLDRAIDVMESAVVLDPSDRDGSEQPLRVSLLHNLVIGLLDRAERIGRDADIDRAVAISEQALAESLAGSPDRAGILDLHARCLWNRSAAPALMRTSAKQSQRSNKPSPPRHPAQQNARALAAILAGS